jgi:hypothetical protein
MSKSELKKLKKKSKRLREDQDDRKKIARMMKQA